MTRGAIFQRFGRFALVGILNNSLCFLVFLALLWAQLSPITANGLCYLLGLVLSYLCNRSWTFRSRNDHLPDVSRFAAAYALGFFVSVLSMWLLIQFMSAPLAQLLTIAITAAFIFAALQLLGFGRPSSKFSGASQ